MKKPKPYILKLNYDSYDRLLNLTRFYHIDHNIITFIIILSLMIPWLAGLYGAQKISYIIFGISQIVMPLAFLYVNDNKVNPFQTSILRGFALVLVNVVIARYYDMGVDFKYDINFKNMNKRNISLAIQGVAVTMAQFYLPLPIVHTICFFSPVFLFVIDYFQNGVKITKIQLYCLLLAIFGIICCINQSLVNKIIDPKYTLTTEFKNYIDLDPLHFSLYGLALIGVMFLWAWGLLRVRLFVKNTHIHSNFHMGFCFLVSSAIMYPTSVTKPSQLSTLFKAFFFTALPLAIAQSYMVAGISLNKKTGQLFMLTALPVIVGYAISYFRYGQNINSMQVIGTLLLLIGVFGVINLGQAPKQTLLDGKQPETHGLQRVYKYIKM